MKKQKYYIVRSYAAGVFAGNIIKRKGKEVEMEDARRLWYWKGASSLSQLAMEGVKCPNECKFPIAVKRLIITEACEILECTKQAEQSIKGVPLWSQQ